MGIVTENQLDTWVAQHQRDAQAFVVDLVERLVAVSCPNPVRRAFPRGDSINQPGPDGVLEVVDSFLPWVPDGKSLWEIGTNRNPADKATSDYKDLTQKIPLEERKETVFVFVTPVSAARGWHRTWEEESQSKWIEKRRQSGEWRDVQVLDGTQLIDWVSCWPAVDLWVASRVLGESLQSMNTIELHWENLRSFGEPPPLTPQLFLAGRNKAAESVRSLMSGELNQVRLQTRFPHQAGDFVAALWASLDEPQRVELAGRSVIVEDVEQWKIVSKHNRPLVIVAGGGLDLDGQQGAALIQEARRRRHSVVLFGPKGGVPDPTSVPLAFPTPHHLQEALESAGYTEERARMLATKSGGNLGWLLRCIQNLSGTPEWSQNGDAANLAVANWLGGWDEESDADMVVAEELSGKGRGEWLGSLRSVVLRPGAPLTNKGGHWRFIGRFEGWNALGGFASSDFLRRFGAVAERVLTESDPAFELPADERYAAPLFGKKRVYSGALSVGIAESLALVGSHGGVLTACRPGEGQALAARVVTSVMAGADWRRWASLGSVLPLLAEAAPAEFLSAVELALGRDRSPFVDLMEQERLPPLGSSYMSGLLWALETLAWDKSYFARAMKCLGGLAAIDPGGNWSNRPSNSLLTILMPWRPQTCADRSHRLASLRRLLEAHENVGWDLVVGLLPNAYAMSSGTRRPVWRDSIPESWDGVVIAADYHREIGEIADLAIGVASRDIDKTKKLIASVDSLPPSAASRLRAYLTSAQVMAVSEGSRCDLWEAVLDIVDRHKRFADADWAMSKEDRDEWVAVATALRPERETTRHKRLFSSREFELLDGDGSYQEQQSRLNAHRKDVLGQLLAEEGVDGVLEFGLSVEAPWRIGQVLGSIDAAVDADIVPGLLASGVKSKSDLARGFVDGRLRCRGWGWIDSLDRSGWGDDEGLQLLLACFFHHEAWTRAAAWCGQAVSAYWQKVAVNPHDAEGELGFAASRLLEHNRPDGAIECLHVMLYRSEVPDAQVVVDALLGFVSVANQIGSVDVHKLLKLVQWAQESEYVSEESAYKIEWAYSSLLNSTNKASPVRIGRRVAKDPDFFCELLSMAFRPSAEELGEADVEEQEESNEADADRAAAAYRVLAEWSVVPGLREDNSVDAQKLSRWVAEVKRIAKQTGRLGVALSTIGRVLAKAPEDPSGLWISDGVARCLDAEDNERMRVGFRVELYNSRGVHAVDPTGKPELELAARFTEKAEHVEKAGYVRVGSVMRNLAEGYLAEAREIVERETPDF